MGSKDEKAHVEKFSEAGEKFKGYAVEWWNLATREKRPKPDPKNFVSVNDLPLYSEDESKTPYKFVPAEPVPFQGEFRNFRKVFNTEYERVTEKFGIVDKAVTKTQDAACKVNKYVNEEWTVLPKAGAITVGGMAGFVLGLKRHLSHFLRGQNFKDRKDVESALKGFFDSQTAEFYKAEIKNKNSRGFIGRVLYTSVGFLTMAAFCYPHETVDMIRTGIAHSEQTWESFKASPVPQKTKKGPDFSPPK
ncbi:hypothetical protein WR25_03342 [Diploscapter pachys]|uniref:Uncharacterized protein n=1 Tax=Diploscapter pachys TaxID=2018661 RepID=A0A2A2L3P1_9BILA|nr:hypothetical protein WR25_03342 [Diploscapter pachys]